MKHFTDSHDKEYLQELMEEFPVSRPPELKQALALLHSRFESLNTEKIIPYLSGLTNSAFQNLFTILPKGLHRFLFQDICSNAGVYRQESDKNNGIIYFGPRQKFQGVPPKDIEEGLHRAFSNLRKDDTTPCQSITRYYQQFILVHPFYDANGRIGRFITDIYLNFYGYAFSWEKLHQNTKWLKKINDCHKRYQSHDYDEYINRLAHHFEECVIHISEGDEEDDW